MDTSSLARLAKLRREVAKLEKRADKQRRALLALPKKLGFSSPRQFLVAFQQALAKGDGAESGAVAGKKRRTRTKITAEIKNQVKDMVKGGKTGTQIIAALGIAPATVARIKTDLGLVKKR